MQPALRSSQACLQVGGSLKRSSKPRGLAAAPHTHCRPSCHGQLELPPTHCPRRELVVVALPPPLAPVDAGPPHPGECCVPRWAPAAATRARHARAVALPRGWAARLARAEPACVPPCGPQRSRSRVGRPSSDPACRRAKRALPATSSRRPARLQLFSAVACCPASVLPRQPPVSSQRRRSRTSRTAAAAAVRALPAGRSLLPRSAAALASCISWLSSPLWHEQQQQISVCGACTAQCCRCNVLRPQALSRTPPALASGAPAPPPGAPFRLIQPKILP